MISKDHSSPRQLGCYDSNREATPAAPPSVCSLPARSRRLWTRTQGLGMAVLTLSVWLLDQRETNDRAERGAGEQTSVGGRSTEVSHTQGTLLHGVCQISACPWTALLVAVVMRPGDACATPHTYMGDHTQSARLPQNAGRTRGNQTPLLTPLQRMLSCLACQPPAPAMMMLCDPGLGSGPLWPHHVTE